MHIKNAALLLALGGVSNGLAAPTPTGEAACAAISSMQAEYKKQFAAANPKAKVTPPMTAPVALATECLFSVPINRKNALAQINGIQKYVQFQSTLAFLKNPPAEDSFQAPVSVDIVGNLTALSHAVRSKAVTKEYDFELKLRNVVAAANDGHFTAGLGGLRAIQFSTPFDLVSVSEDGLKLPQVFQADTSNGILEPVGSAVVSINSQDTTSFLNKLAFGTGLQSPDARYNTLFPSHGVGGAIVADGSWKLRGRYPGQDSFSMTFANGTSGSWPYTAVIAGNFQNVTDAASFYDVFVKGGQAFKSSGSSACGAADAVKARRARKATRQISWASKFEVTGRQDAITPVVLDAGEIFAGYFLESGTAVIQMLAFEPDCFSQVQSTIDSIAKFLALSKQKGAKKLIIDLTNNPGGYILLGYELFWQLFPDTLPYSGQRMRESSAALIEANAFANITYDILNANANSSVYNAAATSNWIYSPNLDENNKYFLNEKQFIGPTKANGDKFSSIWRFNITDQNWGLGLEPRSPDAIVTFSPENIVLLSDSQCSSTCSTFSEFMQTQKQVKSVAVGGIPTAGRGMPLVGGVRGSEILDYGSLLGAAQAVAVLAPTTDSHEISARHRDLPAALPLPMSGNVNYLDNVRKGSSTPLQFIEEPATCRMFYTKKTLGKLESLWAAVDDAAFGSGKGCAVGSFKA